jgi:hypothetical protein
MHSATGMTTTIASAEDDHPDHGVILPDVGPGFQLDQGADGQLGHADRGAGRRWSPNSSTYTSFIRA